MNPLIASLCRDLAPVAIQAALAYLQRFGYLSDAGTASEESIRAAQRVLGVDADGVVGPQTLKAMQTLPRCGCSDVQRLGGVVNQWQRQLATGQGLTFAIDRYTTGLSKSDQDNLLDMAFQHWENVCGVKVSRLSSRAPASRANFVISSSAKTSEEFGQAGNVMKFDDAERWVAEGDRGILYLNVATHEIGHGIGLDHTQVDGELMFPIYAPGVSKPQRQYDVPQGVQRYGEPAVKPVPPPQPPSGVSVQTLARAIIDSNVATNERLAAFLGST